MSEVSSSSSELSNSFEATRQNFNIDWRAKKPVFGEQMAHFCMKEEMSDVEFVFNRNDEITVCFFHRYQLLCYFYFLILLIFNIFQKIPAHAFALSVASETFHKELTYGSENVTEKRSKVLQVRFCFTNLQLIDIEQNTCNFII